MDTERCHTCGKEIKDGEVVRGPHTGRVFCSLPCMMKAGKGESFELVMDAVEQKREDDKRELESLRAENAELREMLEIKDWTSFLLKYRRNAQKKARALRAEKEDLIQRNRISRRRPDLPVDRLELHDTWTRHQYELRRQLVDAIACMQPQTEAPCCGVGGPGCTCIPCRARRLAEEIL